MDVKHDFVWDKDNIMDFELNMKEGIFRIWVDKKLAATKSGLKGKKLYPCIGNYYTGTKTVISKFGLTKEEMK